MDLDDSGSSSVYAQNLDLHLQTTDNTDDVSIAVQFHNFSKKYMNIIFFLNTIVFRFLHVLWKILNKEPMNSFSLNQLC